MVDIGCRIQNIKEASYIIEALEDLDFYFIRNDTKKNRNLQETYRKRKN